MTKKQKEKVLDKISNVVQLYHLTNLGEVERETWSLKSLENCDEPEFLSECNSFLQKCREAIKLANAMQDKHL